MDHPNHEPTPPRSKLDPRMASTREKWACADAKRCSSGGAHLLPSPPPGSHAASEHAHVHTTRRSTSRLCPAAEKDSFRKSPKIICSAFVHLQPQPCPPSSPCVGRIVRSVLVIMPPSPRTLVDRPKATLRNSPLSGPLLSPPSSSSSQLHHPDQGVDQIQASFIDQLVKETYHAMLLQPLHLYASSPFSASAFYSCAPSSSTKLMPVANLPASAATNSYHNSNVNPAYAAAHALDVEEDDKERDSLSDWIDDEGHFLTSLRPDSSFAADVMRPPRVLPPYASRGGGFAELSHEEPKLGLYNQESRENRLSQWRVRRARNFHIMGSKKARIKYAIRQDLSHDKPRSAQGRFTKQKGQLAPSAETDALSIIPAISGDFLAADEIPLAEMVEPIHISVETFTDSTNATLLSSTGI